MIAFTPRTSASPCTRMVVRWLQVPPKMQAEAVRSKGFFNSLHRLQRGVGRAASLEGTGVPVLVPCA